MNDCRLLAVTNTHWQKDTAIICNASYRYVQFFEFLSSGKPGFITVHFQGFGECGTQGIQQFFSSMLLAVYA